MNPRELSPWSMFLAADPLVKAVILSLVFASLVTWTVFLAKSVQLTWAERHLRKRLKRFTSAATLTEAQSAVGEGKSVLSTLVSTAVDEVRVSAETQAGGVQARAASRLADVVRSEGRLARNGMGLLATIGSTAPFVGLFGTVWGIMNSFIGISKAQTTNLAVVAPGIAEALLATAIGLAAAIPAVIIYNHFARATRVYLELVARASSAVIRMLSRELERGKASAPSLGAR
jgi:biopolymer transport protein ExbB